MGTQEGKEETPSHFKALGAIQVIAAVANTLWYPEEEEQQWIKFSPWHYNFLCKAICMFLKCRTAQPQI